MRIKSALYQRKENRTESENTVINTKNRFKAIQEILELKREVLARLHPPVIQTSHTEDDLDEIPF